MKDVSHFGRINTAMTYYLAHFWFFLKILTPSQALINRTEKALDRFVWYPCRKNMVAKKVLKLPSSHGGINYPDICIRKDVDRIMLLIRRYRAPERKSWHSSFDMFLNRLPNRSFRDIDRTIGVPQLYKEIRKLQIKCGFRRLGNFVLIHGVQFHLVNVKSRDLYHILCEA